MSLKRLITFATLVLCLVLLTTTTIFAQPIDIAGHWAEAELTAWVNQGLLGGYADGTVKPDNNITRAEFFAFMNRAFKLSPTDVVEIKDVSESDWYYIDVLTAINHGYVGGYPDGSILPNNLISREEVASVLSRFLNLAPTEDLSALQQFTDAPSDWSKAAVDAVVAAKLMGGYPDGTFRATNPITRAEAIVTINRAMNLPAPEPELVLPNLIGEAGTYGPETGTLTFTGDITINAADVILRNVIITGNLTLGEGIGDGNVTLQNVTVQGETIVNGGGAHSIYLENFTAGDVTVNKPGVRLVATGNTRVSNVIITDSAIIAEVDLDGDGFVDAQISEQLPEGATVELAGNFGTVTVSSAATVNLNGSAATVNVNAGAAVTLGGSVTNLNVAATAAGANVTVNSNASVGTLTANAAVTVSGDGAITTAVINANGVTIAQTPTTTTVAPGITANVGGKEITGTTTPTTPTTGGGGSTTTAPKITSSSHFDVDGNNLVVKSGVSSSQLKIDVDKAGTLDLYVANLKVFSQPVKSGSNIISPAASIEDFNPLNAFTAILLTGLTEQDIYDAVDFTTAFNTLRNAPNYETEVLPMLLEKLDGLSNKAAIFEALDLAGKYATISDEDVKLAIKAAFDDALAIEGLGYDFDDLVGPDSVEVLRDIKKRFGNEFFEKVSYYDLFVAVRDYDGRSDLFGRDTAQAVLDNLKKSDLAKIVVSIYYDPTLSTETKEGIAGCMDIAMLIEKAVDAGAEVKITLKYSSATRNYTVKTN